MSRLRIGIDCRSILRPGAGESAGVGHYVHHLVEAVLAENETRPEDARHEYVLFFDSHGAAEAKRALHAGRANVTVRVLPFRRLASLPFLYSHMIVGGVFGRERLDVLHGPANVVPLFYRRPWVVTLHDLAIYDHPEWFPAEALGTQSFSKSVLVPHSVQHATRVIAVSDATAADATRLFDLQRDRVDVIHLGAGAPVAAPAGNEGRYVLSVGTIEPRKNLETAVEAFVRAARAGTIPGDVRYLIVGGRGWKERGIVERIQAADRELGGGRIVLLGYVSHERKHMLLAGASALLFPSLKEGFGLPLVEAMGYGVPVIASDIPSTREVIAGDAWLAAPDNPALFAAHLRDVLEGGPEVRERAERAKARMALFTWERVARETVACYERAADARVRLGDHDAS